MGRGTPLVLISVMGADSTTAAKCLSAGRQKARRDVAAHGVGVDHQRSGPAGQDDAFQEELKVFLQHFEVGQVMALLAGRRQRAGRASLAAPVQAEDPVSTRGPAARQLVVFLDELGAAVQHQKRGAGRLRRFPAGVPDHGAVGQFQHADGGGGSPSTGGAAASSPGSGKVTSGTDALPIFRSYVLNAIMPGMHATPLRAYDRRATMRVLEVAADIDKAGRGGMEASILMAAAMAGAIVVLTPGPAVLALLGIGAAQGRRAGAGFLVGHLVGDTLWAMLALTALIGARVIAPVVFQTLAVICGAYLLYLGVRAVLVRRDATGQVSTSVRRPLHRGLMFGITNPKSYPVTLSVFTALLAGNLESLTAANAPLLLGAVFMGFLVADAILIWLVGTPPLRRLYRAGEIWIVRATGVMFIGFAVTTLWQALRPA